MPTINKPVRRKKYSIKHNKNADIAKIYNSTKWTKLRNAYYVQHPLCEMCLQNGITKPTEEIHHIRPISTGLDILEMEQIAYNSDNLLALCKECHHKLHKKLRHYEHI